MNKYKKLLSNSLFFSISSIGSKIVLFFLVPLYTNILSTDEYGVADLITTTANLLIPFLTLSINDSILRFTVGKNYKNEKVLTNSIIVLMMGGIILVLSSPVVRYIDVFGDYWFFFITYTILYQFRSSFSVYLQGCQRIKTYVVDGLLYTLLLAIFNIVYLVLLNQSLVGYLKALLLATLCSILFQIAAGGIMPDIRKSEGFDIALCKEMIMYSFPLITNAVSWWVLSSSDRYVLNIFLGPDAVGLYAIAAKMPALVATFTTIISQAWLISSVTEYENGKDPVFFSNTFSVYTVFMLLAVSGVMIFVKPFMNIYVGAEYVCAWVYVPCLLVATVSKAITHYFMALYKAEKKNYRELTITSFGAISNLVLNFVLVPKYKIMGACFATFLAQTMMVIIVMIDTRKIFKFDLGLASKSLSALIILIQMFFVSNDINPVGISIGCFILIIIVNLKLIRSLVAILGGRLKGNAR